MDRQAKISADLQTLRSLCDESTSREERLGLLRSLRQLDFLEPEHQVVFESIRELFPRGRVSVPRLRVHLNNRGFPDIDVENYFPKPRTGHRGKENSEE